MNLSWYHLVILALSLSVFPSFLSQEIFFFVCFTCMWNFFFPQEIFFPLSSIYLFIWSVVLYVTVSWPDSLSPWSSTVHSSWLSLQVLQNSQNWWGYHPLTLIWQHVHPEFPMVPVTCHFQVYLPLHGSVHLGVFQLPHLSLAKSSHKVELQIVFLNQ